MAETELTPTIPAAGAAGDSARAAPPSEAALARAASPRVPTEPKAVSLQERRRLKRPIALGASDQIVTYLLTVGATLEVPPSYGTATRDQWIANFIHLPGNDLLAGAISTVAAKIVATGWYVEGPIQLATLARMMLLFWSRGEAGQGWDSFLFPLAEGYLTRDFGGSLELLRSSATDHDGPAMGYAHLDESKCRLTSDEDYPLIYRHTERGDIKVHYSQCARIVDMPSGQQRYKGLGFCSTSRALTTAQVLMDVVTYKRERLSDLPPAGLLLLDNLSQTQWDDLVTKYDARQRNEGNRVWRDVMIALGVDPAYPTRADFVEFAKLPEHFDEKAATEIAVYSFALAFREDPREFWPVSAGPLGTATEAEIQARKARGKGEGIIYTAIERQLNRPEALPPGVTFHFDFQDDEEDKLRAEINDRKTLWIRRLWEASPNRFGGFNAGGFAQEGEEMEELEEGEEGKEGEEGGEGFLPAQPMQPMPPNEGIISTEQAQQLLVREGVLPADVVGLTVDTDRFYDSRCFGPRVRVYQDGTVRKLLGGLLGV